MKPLATFLTVPRPRKQARTGKKVADERDRFKGACRAYFSPDELRIVQRAAQLCDCSGSEFLRQLALTAAATLGVRDGTISDE